MPKFLRDVCEVCGEAVINVAMLPTKIQDEVYKPGENEIYNTELKQSQGFGEDDEPDFELVDEE